jgi:hypothetical protein
MKGIKALLMVVFGRCIKKKKKRKGKKKKKRKRRRRRMWQLQN